jgi:hypothetical protein
MNESKVLTSNCHEFWRTKIENFDSIYLVRGAELYAVWIDEDCDIDWITTDEYDKIGAKDQQTHNSILSTAAVLECSPCHGLSREAKTHFKRLVGEAISYNIEDDYVTAQKMLSEARTYIRVRSEEISRRWYLSASVAMCAVMIFIEFMIWIFRESITGLLGDDFIWLSLAIVAGSCGALLSVILRSGHLKFDCSAGEALHYLEGASRIWAGALSGVFVALAVKSEFVLAPLARGGNATAVTMLAALVAGTGERFATSIISTFEATHLTTTKKLTDKSDREDINE